MDRQKGEQHETQDHGLERDVHQHVASILYDRSHVDMDPAELHTNFDSFEVDDQEMIATNMHALSMLNGHVGSRLRAVVKDGISDEANHLRWLRDWSQQADPSQVEFSGITQTGVPDLMQDIDGSTDVYERLMLKEKHPHITSENYQDELTRLSSAALGSEETLRWMDMWDAMLEGNMGMHIESLLRHVGIIPTQMFTKKRFVSMNADEARMIHASLKDAPPGLVAESQHERAKFLNHMFSSGLADRLRQKKKRHVQIDHKGLLMDIQGIHAHIPFGLITDSCVAALQFGHWLDAADVMELKVRRAHENNDVEQMVALDHEQTRQFIGGWDAGKSLDDIADEIIEHPEKAGRKLFKTGEVVPDALLDELMRRGDEGVYAVMRTAEMVSTEISGERLSRRNTLFLNYELGEETDRSYVARKTLLGHPDYYNVTKIAKAVEVTGSDDGKLLRGHFKKSARGEQHAFLCATHEGKFTRNLVGAQERRTSVGAARARNIPTVLDMHAYERIEHVLNTFDYATRAAEALEKLLNEKPKNWKKRVRGYREVIEHFTLMHVTDQMDALMEFGFADEEIPEESQQNYVNVIKDTLTRYDAFIDANMMDDIWSTERVTPEVKATDMHLANYKPADIEAVTAKDGSDRYLLKNAPPIRIVELHYKEDDPSKTVPYHIEEEVLEKLRINRNRPLINIVDGCRFVDDPLVDYGYADAITRVAHAHTANVAIPGTQSGVGVAFGRANVEYVKDMDHLARADKAHFFAISPAANTYYPGNKMSENATQNERYVVSPVDVIVTPFASGWELQGMDRLKADYMRHAEHGGMLSARIAYEQKNITIVGGGGLYTLADTMSLMKWGSTIFILDDTGRSATLLGAIAGDIETAPDDRSKMHEWIAARLEGGDEELLEELFRKDYGEGETPQNENQEAYREMLFRFIQMVKLKKGKILISTESAIEDDLNSYLEN